MHSHVFGLVHLDFACFSFWNVQLLCRYIILHLHLIVALLIAMLRNLALSNTPMRYPLRFYRSICEDREVFTACKIYQSVFLAAHGRAFFQFGPSEVTNGFYILLCSRANASNASRSRHS